MIDFLDFDNISDEILAAYIEGNATEQEASLIQDAMRGNDSLADTIEIVNDSLIVDNYMEMNYPDLMQSWMQDVTNINNTSGINMPFVDLFTNEDFANGISLFDPNEDNMFDNNDIIKQDI